MFEMVMCSWKVKHATATDGLFTFGEALVTGKAVSRVEKRNKINHDFFCKGLHVIAVYIKLTRLFHFFLSKLYRYHFKLSSIFVLHQSKPLSIMGLVEDFNAYRSKMNEKIMASDSLIVKRIFNLDTNAYAQGHLDVKSKELIGLTCSLVLRCDDCVKYHLGKCKEVGFSTDEVQEAMGVATLIGGTIVIPHLRRAFEFWEELQHV